MRAALALLLVLALVQASAAKRRGRAPVVQPESASKVGVKLRGVDLKRRLALLEVSGLSQPPQANFFTLTDVRGRRYVGFAVRCDEPFASGTRVCELELPEGYERHELKSVELHTKGLHGPTVAIDSAEVSSAWAGAQTLAEPPAEGAAAK